MLRAWGRAMHQHLVATMPCVAQLQECAFVQVKASLQALGRTVEKILNGCCTLAGGRASQPRKRKPSQPEGGVVDAV